jgi:hypothetical protein
MDDLANPPRNAIGDRAGPRSELNLLARSVTALRLDRSSSASLPTGLTASPHRDSRRDRAPRHFNDQEARR